MGVDAVQRERDRCDLAESVTQSVAASSAAAFRPPRLWPSLEAGPLLPSLSGTLPAFTPSAPNGLQLSWQSVQMQNKPTVTDN